MLFQGDPGDPAERGENGRPGLPGKNGLVGKQVGISYGMLDDIFSHTVSQNNTKIIVELCDLPLGLANSNVELNGNCQRFFCCR